MVYGGVVAVSLPSRRTQAERSAKTQARVLDAAIEVLLEGGYSKLSTTRVAERASVSRGALLHQYPTKEALVVAAVEHVAARWGAELREQAAGLPAEGDRIGGAHRLLWSALCGDLFYSALELWVAGRTDPDLRETLLPLERTFIREARALATVLYGDELQAHPRCREAVEVVLATMRGAALASVLTPDRPARLDLALLDDVVHALLDRPAS